MLNFTDFQTVPVLKSAFTSIGLAFTLLGCSTPRANPADLAESTILQAQMKAETAPIPRSSEVSKSSEQFETRAAKHVETQNDHIVEHEARPYDETRNAQEDVERALADAARFNKRALIVMGANWCHDSRALAGVFETSRFQTLINANYILTYVDVGQKNRNIDIAKDFGLKAGIVGTPTVIITEANGQVLNLDTAPTWRNAASRNEDEIFIYFEGFTHDKL